MPEEQSNFDQEVATLYADYANQERERQRDRRVNRWLGVTTCLAAALMVGDRVVPGSNPADADRSAGGRHVSTLQAQTAVPELKLRTCTAGVPDVEPFEGKVVVVPRDTDCTTPFYKPGSDEILTSVKPGSYLLANCLERNGFLDSKLPGVDGVGVSGRVEVSAAAQARLTGPEMHIPTCL